MNNNSIIIPISPLTAQKLINKETDIIILNRRLSSKNFNKIYLYLSHMQTVPFNLRDKVDCSLIEKCGLVFAEVDGTVFNGGICVENIHIYKKPKRLSDFSKVVKIKYEEIIKCLKDKDYPKGYIFVL